MEDKGFLYCCLLLICLTGTQALLCYWCSGVGDDRDCEKHPYDVRTGPIYLNCRSSFCITAKVIDAKTGHVESFARLCDNIPRGNQCVRDSRLITCYQTCTRDLCNSANPGPQYLHTVNYASDDDNSNSNSNSNRRGDSHLLRVVEDDDGPEPRDGAVGSWLDSALEVGRYNNLEASLGFRERLERAGGKERNAAMHGDAETYEEAEKYGTAEGYGNTTRYGDADEYRNEANNNNNRTVETARRVDAAKDGDGARHAARAEGNAGSPFLPRISPLRVPKDPRQPREGEGKRGGHSPAGGSGSDAINHDGGDDKVLTGSHRQQADAADALREERNSNAVGQLTADESETSEASIQPTPESDHYQQQQQQQQPVDVTAKPAISPYHSGFVKNGGRGLQEQTPDSAQEELSGGIVMAHHPSYYISAYRSDVRENTGDTVKMENNGDSVRKTKNGDNVEKTKNGDNVGKTKNGDNVEKTKNGDSVEKTKIGDNVEKTKIGDNVDKTKNGDSVGKTKIGDNVEKTKIGDNVDKTKNGDSVGKTKNGDNVEKTKNGDSVGKTKNGDNVEKTKNGDSVGKTKNGDSVEKTKNGDNVGKTKNGDSAGKTKNGDNVEKTKNGDNMEKTKNGDNVVMEKNGDNVEKTKNGDNVGKTKNGDNVVKEKNGDNVEKTKNGDNVGKTKNGDNVGKTKNGDSVEKTNNGDSVEKTNNGDHVEIKAKRVGPDGSNEDDISEPASTHDQTGSNENHPQPSISHKPQSRDHNHAASLAFAPSTTSHKRRTQTPSSSSPSLMRSTDETFAKKPQPSATKASNASFELSELSDFPVLKGDPRPATSSGKSHRGSGRRQPQFISRDSPSAALRSGFTHRGRPAPRAVLGPYGSRGVSPSAVNTFPADIASVSQYMYPVHSPSFPHDKALLTSKNLPSRPSAYLYPNSPFASPRAMDREPRPQTNRTMETFGEPTPARIHLRTSYSGVPRNHHQLYLRPSSGGFFSGDRVNESAMNPATLPQPFPYSGLRAKRNQSDPSTNSQSSNSSGYSNMKGDNSKDEAFTRDAQNRFGSRDTRTQDPLSAGRTGGKDASAVHGGDPGEREAERWVGEEEEEDVPTSLTSGYSAAFVESGYVRDSFDSLVSAFRQHPENRYPDFQTEEEEDDDDHNENISGEEMTTPTVSAELFLRKPQPPTPKTSTSRSRQFQGALRRTVSADGQRDSATSLPDGWGSSNDFTIKDDEETNSNQFPVTRPVSGLRSSDTDSDRQASPPSTDSSVVITDHPETQTRRLTPQSSSPKSTNPTRNPPHDDSPTRLKQYTGDSHGSVKSSKAADTTTSEETLTNETNMNAPAKSSPQPQAGNRKTTEIQTTDSSSNIPWKPPAKNSVRVLSTPQTTSLIASPTNHTAPTDVNPTASANAGDDVTVSNPAARPTRTQTFDARTQPVHSTHRIPSVEMTTQQHVPFRLLPSKDAAASTIHEQRGTKRQKGQTKAGRGSTPEPPETGSSTGVPVTESVTSPQIPSASLSVSTAPVSATLGRHDPLSPSNTSIPTVLRGNHSGNSARDPKAENEVTKPKTSSEKKNNSNTSGRTVTFRLRKTNTRQEGTRAEDHHHHHHPQQAKTEDKRHVLTSKAELSQGRDDNGVIPDPARRGGFGKVSYTRGDTPTTTASAAILLPGTKKRMHSPTPTPPTTNTATLPPLPSYQASNPEPLKSRTTTQFARHGGLSARSEVQTTTTTSGSRRGRLTSLPPRAGGARSQLPQPFSTEASTPTTVSRRTEVREKLGHFRENLGHIHDAKVDSDDVGKNGGKSLRELRVIVWVWTVMCITYGYFA